MAPRRRARGYRGAAVALLAVLAGATAVLVRQGFVYQPPTVVWGGVVLLWLGLLPAWAFYFRGLSDDIPLLPLHGIFYAAAYAWPVFWESPGFGNPGGRWLEDALALTIAGLAVLYFGYYVVGAALFRHVKSVHLPRPASVLAARGMAWCFVFIQMLFPVLPPAVKALPSLGQFVEVVGTFGLALLLAHSFARELPAREIVLLYGLVVPALLVRYTASGAVAPVFTFLIFLALIYVYVQKKVPPLAVVLVGALLVVFLQGGKAEYRQLTWGGAYEDAGTFEKAVLFARCSMQQLTGQGSAAVLETSTNRLNQLWVFATVMQETPAQVPYQGGRTYLPLLTKWIPRALWPGKPEEITGNQFGRLYGLLATNDETTSLNLPWLAEFYMNFGLAGVLSGMFLVGLFFRLLRQMLCTGRAGPQDYAMALAVALRLYWAESNLSLMVGNIFLGLVAIFLVFSLLRRPRQRRRVARAVVGGTARSW